MKTVTMLFKKGHLTATQLRAAERWKADPYKMMLAPGLFRVLHDAIFKDLPVEQIEARWGWPARSAKAIIGLILTSIEECDGMLIARPEVADAKLRDELEFLTATDGSAAQAEAAAALGVTVSQYRLLEMLRRAKGLVVSKDILHRRLYSGVPEADVPAVKIIDVQICKLRQRLEAARARERVETVWGVGYRIAEDGAKLR